MEIRAGRAPSWLPWSATPRRHRPSWALTTARLPSEAERSLADEAQGPLARLLAIPSDGGDDSGFDPLAMLKRDIAAVSVSAVRRTRH